MKRYNKIIFKGLFLAGLIGLFSSCEDFLTRDKPNASTDDDSGKHNRNVNRHLVLASCG